MESIRGERWLEISPYLDQALSLPEAERAAWLESLHASDPTLARTLEGLLAEHCALVQGRFLEDGPMHPGIDSACPGQTIGSYRLTGLLGEGGMGSVWLAERSDGRFERRVAVKFLHFSLAGRLGLERFRREGKILGQLQHPHIAQLIDAGITAEGRPYLVLEYVEGKHIDRYCDDRKLSVTGRIHLFLDVLSAVADAHSHLVVHRDIKPSNALVGTNGVVKLLDFGIAKLLDDESDAAPATLLTLEDGGALTPQFAAPEQINGGEVTTATDVYALGALLYVLLTGQHPLGDTRQSPAALIKAILETEAPRASNVVFSGSTLAAEQRATTPEKLKRHLRGDLDTIIGKALKKAPVERYASVSTLADDLRRYLKREPISARPDSAAYRTAQFVRRNKLAVLASAIVLLTLAGGLTVALWQANIARKEARTAAAVEQFTEDIFRLNNRVNPNPKKAQQTTARQLLDMGAQKVSSSLNDAPEAKLQMTDLLGSLYQNLELSDQAVALRKERVAVARKLYGSESPQIVPALVDLGRAMQSSRSVSEREAVLLEAKSLLDRGGDVRSKIRGTVLAALAENYTSTDVKKASTFAQESIEVLRSWPGSPELELALGTAGFAYISAGQFAEAEAAMAEAIQLSKRLHGDPNIDLPHYYATEARAQLSLLKYDAAESSYRAAYKDARALSGEADVDTFMVEGRLGMLLVLTARSREALPYLETALEACLRTKGADDPFFTPQMEMQYGNGLDAAGRLEDALVQISNAVDNRREHRPGTAYLAQMLEDQAEVLVELGRYQAAEQALKEDERIREKVHVKIGDGYLRPRVRLALEQGHLHDAEAVLDKYAGPITRNAPISVGLIRNFYARSEIALQTRNTATAILLARDLRRRLADAHMETYLRLWRVRALTWEARAYLMEDKAQDALPLLDEAVDSQKAMFDGQSPELGATEALLGCAYLAIGNRARAVSLMRSSEFRLRPHRELCVSYRRAMLELQHRLAGRSPSNEL